MNLTLPISFAVLWFTVMASAGCQGTAANLSEEQKQTEVTARKVREDIEELKRLSEEVVRVEFVVRNWKQRVGPVYFSDAANIAEFKRRLKQLEQVEAYDGTQYGGEEGEIDLTMLDAELSERKASLTVGHVWFFEENRCWGIDHYRMYSFLEEFADEYATSHPEVVTVKKHR